MTIGKGVGHSWRGRTCKEGSRGQRDPPICAGKKKNLRDKTDVSESGIILTASAKNTTVKRQQPDVEQCRTNRSDDKRINIYIFFHIYLQIWFPEMSAEKNRESLKTKTPSCWTTKNYKTLPFPFYWSRKIKTTGQSVLSHVTNVTAHYESSDQKPRCGLSPAPMQFTEGCAPRVPIIHNCSGDRPVNPQCHCSQTTVENEVSKRAARWHYELISPRRSSRPGDAVAGLWKDSQGLWINPLVSWL